jgi:hypothetical protein
MTKVTALSDLAGFVAQSKFAAEDTEARRAAVNSMVRDLENPSVHRRVSDLLGAVMTLSARTRRIVQPRVDIDLDVFSPQSTRAVRVVQGPKD